MTFQLQEIVVNRKIMQNYTILERIEAGIVLVGTEVKAIRGNLVNLQAAYAKVEEGELFLHDLYIQAYEPASHQQHALKRKRKLLLHRREISKLLGKVSVNGYALVPLRLYWRNALVKVELAVGKGKTLHDKREVLKKKVMQREAAWEISRSTFLP